MNKRYLLTTTAAFLVVFLTAGAWMGVVSRIAPGQPGLAVTLLGAVFSAAFVAPLASAGYPLIAPHTDPGARSGDAGRGRGEGGDRQREASS